MKFGLIIALFTSIVISILFAAPPLASSACQFSGTLTGCAVFQDWLPIILVGITAAISLTVVYYLMGVLLNSTRVKASALQEIQQILGTVLLVAIILGIMQMIGSATGFTYQNLLNGPGPGGSAPVTNQVDNICRNILSHSQVTFLNSKGSSVNFPGPYPNLPEATNEVCKIVENDAGLDSITQHFDYGLAASYVITANLTNQSVVELNAAYNFDSLIFFLRTITSYADICGPLWCVLPVGKRTVEIVMSFNIYSGYVFHRVIMPTLTTQANLSIYLFTSQLTLIMLLLSSWPYLLAGGILLRTFSMTRRAGGIFIAAVVVGMIIYPTIFLFQYASLNNLPSLPLVGSQAPGSGVSGVPNLALCGVDINNGQFLPYLDNPQRGDPGVSTQYRMWCYTFANQLPLTVAFKSMLSPNTDPNAVAYCNRDGYVDPKKDRICACPRGVSAWTAIGPAGTRVPWQDSSSAFFPSCYYQKSLSFYTFPIASSVIRLYSCYAPDYSNPQSSNPTSNPSGILEMEAHIINSIDQYAPLRILLSLSTIISQAIPGGTSPTGPSPLTFNPGVPCGIAPNNVMGALVGLINLYGIISVVGFILPLINILMMLSVTFGLSSLMGGETSILGLSRFL